VVGTILGRNLTNKEQPQKQRYNQFPSPIPTKSLLLNRSSLILLSGILPFGSIFIETYFIFTSFWNYKYYYVYGFMLLVYVILIIVTSCVAIVSTYFLLNAEDHR
jgi:transmembrane 9 superfamily member 3